MARWFYDCEATLQALQLRLGRPILFASIAFVVKKPTAATWNAYFECGQDWCLLPLAPVRSGYSVTYTISTAPVGKGKRAGELIVTNW